MTVVQGHIYQHWKADNLCLCVSDVRALRRAGEAIFKLAMYSIFFSCMIFYVLALQIQMKDFRFSYKFKMACKEDVLKLCPNIKKK